MAKKSKETNDEKWARLMVRHSRWAKLTMEQLRGAEYAFRVLHTSPTVRGAALELLEALIGQVCAEKQAQIDNRPAEATKGYEGC